MQDDVDHEEFDQLDELADHAHLVLLLLNQMFMKALAISNAAAKGLILSQAGQNRAEAQ